MKIFRIMGLIVLMVLLLVIGFGKLAVFNHSIGWGIFLGLTHVFAGLVVFAFAMLNVWEDQKVKTTSQNVLGHILQNRVFVLLFLSVFSMVGVILFLSQIEDAGFVFLLESIWLSNFEQWSSTTIGSYNFVYPITIMVSGSIQVLSATLGFSICVLSWKLFLESMPQKNSVQILKTTTMEFLRILNGIPYLVVLLASRVLDNDKIVLQTSWEIYQTTTTTLGITRPIFWNKGIALAMVFLGAQLSLGLWKWSEMALLDIKSTPYGRLSELNGTNPSRLLWREVFWLEKWTEMTQQFCIGLSSLFLVDLLANSVCDVLSYEKDLSIPLYMSLGNFQIYNMEEIFGLISPAHFFRLEMSLVVLLFCSLMMVCVVSYGNKQGVFRFQKDGNNRYINLLLPNDKILFKNIHAPYLYNKAPYINFVLGDSGVGKSSLLCAMYNDDLKKSIYVFQDPDYIFPDELSIAETVQMGIAHQQETMKRMEYILRNMIPDNRLLLGLSDENTPVRTLSRGERQRLLFIMTMAVLQNRLDTGERGLQIFFDEFTSAQDEKRTGQMFQLLQDVANNIQYKEKFSIYIITHDPACLVDAFLQQKNTKVLWLSFTEKQERTVSLYEWDVYTKEWKGEEDNQSVSDEKFRAYMDNVDSMYEKHSVHARHSKNSRFVLQQIKNRIPVGPNFLQWSSSLELRPKEVTLLRGPSGVGKSTLVAWIIQQYLQSDRGVVIGWIPQDPGRAFPKHMNVTEALLLQDEINETYKDRAQKLYGNTALPWNQLIGSLSEGQRQRIAIVREQIRLLKSSYKKKVLIMDEPFGSLDPENHIRLMEEFCEWLKDNTENGQLASILLISHTPDIDINLAYKSDISVNGWDIIPLET